MAIGPQTMDLVSFATGNANGAAAAAPGAAPNLGGIAEWQTQIAQIKAFMDEVYGVINHPLMQNLGVLKGANSSGWQTPPAAAYTHVPPSMAPPPTAPALPPPTAPPAPPTADYMFLLAPPFEITPQLTLAEWYGKHEEWAKTDSRVAAVLTHLGGPLQAYIGIKNPTPEAPKP